ncbi:MAG: NADH-quinone oxidoreductase subunit L [Acidobacteria bacterium]|nr:MAG: NADH-quinone oxidoreductase subunit L [Acidobacteriota bacterium]
MNTIWLIPLLPALGGLVHLLVGRRLANKLASLVSVGLPGLSFAWALGCFYELLGRPDHSFATTLYTWIPAGAFHLSNGAVGDLTIQAGILLDPLSAVMLLVVTGVGFLIHVYSIGYMAHEGGYYRFFGYMNLFLFSMLVLILADNYLMMFAGWEGVGLCSYFLIGFYFNKKSAAAAGKKAFVVNRIGDAGFLLGVMLLTVTFGTLDFQTITDAARKGEAASRLLSVGDPVVTAIWAASIGLVQNDIKRVLAYSTVSQLGYMFLACGVGAFAAAIFHLMTHAFFKALLFLGAGSVIHALSGEQDMRKMGGLWSKIPGTAWTMLAATLAISGVPPLAGVFSKEEILASAFAGNKVVWGIGLFTAGLTAFYMFRLFFMTFWGNSRVAQEAEHHIHESPWTMLGPLVVLAALSVVGGFVGATSKAPFAAFLDPVFAKPPAQLPRELDLVLTIAAVLVATAGIIFAYQMYVRRRELPDRAAQAAGPVYHVVLNKYYVDELYDAIFVNRVKNLGNSLAAFDLGVVDGGVNGAGWLTRLTADASGLWDLYVVDGLVNLLAFFVKGLGWAARAFQTGLVQSYAFFIVMGVLLLMAYYLVHF